MLFLKAKKIRKTIHNNEWCFSVVDVVETLTESPTPRQYWGKVKQREFIEIQVSPVWVQLKLKALDGKSRFTDCANTEGIFRIIQSIPSKKAESFKRWLAKVGKERLDEIENPELAQARMKLIYEQKGYPKDWIDKRLRGMAIRQNLTDEWQERGINGKDNYAILTAEISKATFGMIPNEYKEHKSIPEESKANLRDNMTDLELIFTILGEKVTTEISKVEKPTGMPNNKKVANRGGKVAGNARKETEKEIGKSVISENNFLSSGENNKLSN